MLQKTFYANYLFKQILTNAGIRISSIRVNIFLHMSEIQIRLKEKIQEAETIRKIRSHTSQLISRLAEEEKALAVMETTLAKEQRDVELLEKEGLTTMLHKFLGDREERLQRERQDYVTAALKYNELYKSVELIRYELDLLNKKEQNLGVVESEIVALMKRREEEIVKMEPEAAAVLKELYNQLDRLHKYEVEVDEAIRAGQDSLEKIGKTEYYLNEGQFPSQQMWGRNYKSSYVNRQAIDYARDMAYQSRQSLIRFGNEYREVYPERLLQLNIELEDFGKFSEYFIQNIITDWIIRKTINKSLVNVRGTKQQVEMLLDQLQREKITISNKLVSIDQQKKEMIVNNIA